MLESENKEIGARLNQPLSEHNFWMLLCNEYDTRFSRAWASLRLPHGPAATPGTNASHFVPYAQVTTTSVPSCVLHRGIARFCSRIGRQ